MPILVTGRIVCHPPQHMAYRLWSRRWSIQRTMNIDTIRITSRPSKLMAAHLISGCNEARLHSWPESKVLPFTTDFSAGYLFCFRASSAETPSTKRVQPFSRRFMLGAGLSRRACGEIYMESKADSPSLPKLLRGFVVYDECWRIHGYRDDYRTSGRRDFQIAASQGSTYRYRC